jgi:hypothetical protein
MVRHVIRVAENGARRPKSPGRQGVNFRTRWLDSDQCAARGQVGIRGPVGARTPCPGDR